MLGLSEKLCEKYYKKLYPFGQACFYLGLITELLVVILDKSAWINPFEGQLFRITFVLFGLKLVCSRYNWREWLWILFFGIIAGVCYLCSDRDEAVRLVVFCAAFQDVDLKKALKLTFGITLTGCLVLMALAVTGLFGNMYIVDEADRGIRYCFGLGHPNAFYCMLWVLVTLGIYLYHENMKLWHFGVLALLGLAFYIPTNSRTGFLLLLFTLALSMVMKYAESSFTNSRWFLLLGIAGLLLCVGLSVWIACYETYQGPFYRFDRFFTGRITSMNNWTDGGGRIINWRLFSRPENVKFFDMGYIRLFYWYGIIPGAVYVILYARLMWDCGRRKDPMAFMMLASFAFYTLIEAHFISVYLGRNYALFLLGAYWTRLVPTGSPGHLSPAGLKKPAGTQEPADTQKPAVFLASGKKGG